MIPKELTNPADTAVLVIDIQNDYCSSDGRMAQEIGLDVSPVQEIVPRLIEFVEKARQAGFPIIFTQMIEDPEYMAPNAKLKAGDGALCSPDTEGFKYYKIQPEPTDHQIVKKTYDAFSNPELEAILKRENIRNIIVIGAYTAVCVDTTIRSGFTRGYNMVVPEDLVSMPAERINQHEAAIQIWNGLFAHVGQSNDIIS